MAAGTEHINLHLLHIDRHLPKGLDRIGVKQDAAGPGNGADLLNTKEIRLRDYLIDRIEKEIPYCRLNGHRTRRLPGNVNFSFRFVEGESILLRILPHIPISPGNSLYAPR